MGVHFIFKLQPIFAIAPAASKFDGRYENSPKLLKNKNLPTTGCARDCGLH